MCRTNIEPSATYPSVAAFIGMATVSALLPARINSEGPILVLEKAKYEVVRCCAEIPTGAAGVMFFSAGPIILKEAVWITLSSVSAPSPTHSDSSACEAEAKLGYVISKPIAYERFCVLGNRFRFKVKAGQPGWQLAPGPIPDDATAAWLNLFLLS